jgi:schlafen family protein
MKRDYYSDSITNFLETSPHEIFGQLNEAHTLSSEPTQKGAWLEEINILRDVLVNREGRIYFEYAIPRMGKRIDVVLLIDSVVFVLEFKVGESWFTSYALDQVCDYALDLKNFHESSHDQFIVPVLIATDAHDSPEIRCAIPQNDKLLSPIRCNLSSLGNAFDEVLRFVEGNPNIDPEVWERGRYCPTPTIIEAALALYRGHSVEDITRHEADKPDIALTSNTIDEIIRVSRDGGYKSICFVTGVPGAGKTLVGLDAATKHQDKNDGLYSVFLSGNGPLVAILREALARDHMQSEMAQGRRLRKGEARSKVRAFIQPVHEFRDEGIKDPKPPIEHVALFDEAQRAWHRAKTADFLKRRKGVPDFAQSEPEFLISCLDRHADWAVIVCLVGGGQEIHTGEAGITEWIESLNRAFPDWHIYISSRLTDSEYGAGRILDQINSRPHVVKKDELHLSVSMRSFRAENLSRLIKELLDLEAEAAFTTLKELGHNYPIFITRDLTKAKRWLKTRARGSERYGIIVSSQAERLKPHAIDVKSPIDPIHWFLDGKEDVRSSYYLEDVATEFHIQGLELDWACVTWDADFRHTPNGWQHFSFVGDHWNHIRKPERQMYLKNAYRVLLTRARQGMIIVVPSGDTDDPTRKPEFYDPTFEYLKEIGFQTL